VPTAACFGTKVQSSGNSSTYKSCVVDKRPHDGSLVPKHVVAGT